MVIFCVTVGLLTEFEEPEPPGVIPTDGDGDGEGDDGLAEPNTVVVTGWLCIMEKLITMVITAKAKHMHMVVAKHHVEATCAHMTSGCIFLSILYFLLFLKRSENLNTFL